MRHFSNLTRVQNMGWELKYFAISRNVGKKITKKYQAKNIPVAVPSFPNKI